MTDQDIVTRLAVDLGDTTRDAVTVHASARAFGDLDGRRRDDPFRGLDQSYGDPLHAWLYTAHADLHRQGWFDLVRLGRQDLDEAPTPLSFDGVRADTRAFGPHRLFGSVYGGVPVHHFEASRHGDAVAGAAAGFVPWTGARVRGDAMHLRDEFLAVDRRDDLLGLRWWQQLGPAWLHGLHTWRDARPRDLVVGGRADLGGVGTLDADYRELLSTQRQQVTELDPFYDIAVDYAPYRQVQATWSRDLGPNLDAAVGAELRRLRDAGDEREFNREFERYHAALTCTDLLVPGLSLTVAGSLWDSTGEDFRTLTGELSWRPDPALRIAAGSGYDLYRYDLFAGRERVHVRSWYLRFERRIAASLRLDAGYELERDDLDEFHLFRLGATWTF